MIEKSDNEAMNGDRPTLLFKTNTRGMPLKSALEFWQQSAGSLYDVTISQPEAFHTTHCTFRFGELLLTHCISVAQKLNRSSYRVAADGYDHFEIQFFLKGHWSRQDGRQEAHAAPGDLIIHDTAQAHAGSASDFSNLTLFVPRSLLAPLLMSPDEHNMRVLAAHEPIVGLLRNHLDALWQVLPLLDEKQAAALALPTAELVAATLNGGAREDTSQGVAAVQLGEIRRYIDANALDTDLSPVRIAAAFGISLRKLTYLFSGDGGVASYLQRRRLTLARSALRDPAQAHKSIAAIGLEHGFVYAHNFTRAFQRLHGLTPREIRAVAQRNWISGTNESQSWFARAALWGGNGSCVLDG
ncbi:helix-turn-helix domain-containing protein [Neorhizobium petrolearium]|uniref:Helix-turn-helix domain-containing protein n=2 Tax=Neorhizobium TaxID=1525371 RepID=A0ABY8LXX8_9HYPH|nr:helix-turn-helix domain-containing protein [Neorhizobium petrolearium]MCC2610994.1 helix-turn-helix domain-containing protein [Neorhizobium petrolearium]WGI66214.1 helix-turn-helix domain-containing protein [Neorhizobium petrolearium]